MLKNAAVISNGKGGVGKTSLSANVAGLAAEAGYRVLCVDLDPQGSLGRDLNYFNKAGVDDRGQSLIEAIQFERPITPVKDVRPGLDVIPGGPFLDDAVRIAPSLGNRGRDPRLVLLNALKPLEDQYHLIVIDSPPGDRYLADIAMCASHFVLIPTRSDEASLDGLTRTAAGFTSAREVNPGLELLGVVLFGIGASATVIERQVRAKVTEGLGGAAPLFHGSIRYLEAPAVEARDRGMLVHEYERDLVANAPRWYERRGKGANAPEAPRVARTAHKLAEDYARVATEVLTLVAERNNALTEAAGA